MIRIMVGNKILFYPIIGERCSDNEQCSDSFNQGLRCETPYSNLRSLSPTTPPPHSFGFNR